MVDGIRISLRKLLGDRGHHLEAEPGDQEQPVDVRLLGALLREAGDPDFEVFSTTYPAGVRVGVGAELPRTPAVYEEKVRWRIKSQEDPEAAGLDPDPGGTWQVNHKSARDYLPAVEKELWKQVERSQCLALTPEEAAEKYGDTLIVASLGALVKETDERGEVRVRVLFDGTFGVPLNDRIRVRDQEQFPGGNDLKRLLREQASVGGRWFGLTADVKDAHRVIAIHPRDWRLLGMQPRAKGTVFINKRGTFGVASASYWWGRMASAIARLQYYVLGQMTAAWVLVLADDYKIEASGENFVAGLLTALLLFDVLQVPLSWRKCRGGDRYPWVGYEVDLSGWTLGLTVSRANWLVTWFRKCIKDKLVNIGDFAAGLGRASFAFGALEYDRPFLAPLFTFASLYVPRAVRPLPGYVLLVMAFLAERLERRRALNCAARRVWWPEGPRVDAKAEGTDAAIGGWLPARGPEGQLSPGHSRWFAAKVDQTNAPWAFKKNDQPYRFIASLEALAVLSAVVAFGPEEGSTPTGITLLVPSWTDNRGNTFALSRLMSTKFPLSAIVMELAAQLEARGLTLELGWAPRAFNQEADDLSNFQLDQFSPERRVPFDIGDYPWKVLPRLLVAGEAFIEEARLARENKGPQRRATQKRRREDRLRVRDPW